ncbi:hypothetical protein BKA62DRAFT_739185 [Auriculariales sp. MPI-PUGE-AT-0066]|nr:hypothetical protein BKA62DRAFT_739185 [Auriculariales sp. MPI-PUGE-AT-0066]
MLALQSSSSSNVRRVSARQPPSAWGSIAGHSTTSLSKQRSISSSDSLPLSPPSLHAQAKPRSSSSSSNHYRLEPQDLELQDLAALRESFFAAPAQSTSHTSLLPTPSLKQANAKSPAPPPTGSTTQESRKKEEEKPAADEVDPKEPLDPHLRTIFLLAKAVLRSPQVVSDMLNGAPTVGQPSGTAVSPVVPPATEAPPPVTALVRTKRIHGLMELLSAAEHINTSGRLREKGLTRDADPRHLYASEFFEIAYGRWKDVLAGTAKNDAKAASRPATGSVQPPRRASEDTTLKTSPPTSVDEHSPSLAVPQSNSVTFPGGSESVPLPEASKLETVSEEDATHDLLAKLCAAALRANLPSSALRHATTALESSPYAIRARLFAAAACLDLGRLADAQKHLSQLPPDLTDVRAVIFQLYLRHSRRVPCRCPLSPRLVGPRTAAHSTRACRTGVDGLHASSASVMLCITPTQTQPAIQTVSPHPSFQFLDSPRRSTRWSGC